MIVEATPAPPAPELLPEPSAPADVPALSSHPLAVTLINTTVPGTGGGNNTILLALAEVTVTCLAPAGIIPVVRPSEVAVIAYVCAPVFAAAVAIVEQEAIPELARTLACGCVIPVAAVLDNAAPPTITV